MTALVDLIGQRVRIYDGLQSRVRAEGQVIGILECPAILVQQDDGAIVHEASTLPRDVIDEVPFQAQPDRLMPSCTQCGQRTPVCADCSDSIIFMPKSGFGQQGEWRHLAPPRSSVGHHQARPKVFVS